MWCFNNGTQWSFSIGLLTKILKLIEIIGIIYCQYWHCRAAISSHLTQDSKNAIFSFKIIFMLLTCLGRYICFSEILIHNSLIFTSTTFNACMNFIMVFLSKFKLWTEFLLHAFCLRPAFHVYCPSTKWPVCHCPPAGHSSLFHVVTWPWHLWP